MLGYINFKKYDTASRYVSLQLSLGPGILCPQDGQLQFQLFLFFDKIILFLFLSNPAFLGRFLVLLLPPAGRGLALEDRAVAPGLAILIQSIPGSGFIGVSGGGDIFGLHRLGLRILGDIVVLPHGGELGNVLHYKY